MPFTITSASEGFFDNSACDHRRAISGFVETIGVVTNPCIEFKRYVYAPKCYAVRRVDGTIRGNMVWVTVGLFDFDFELLAEARTNECSDTQNWLNQSLLECALYLVQNKQEVDKLFAGNKHVVIPIEHTELPKEFIDLETHKGHMLIDIKSPNVPNFFTTKFSDKIKIKTARMLTSAEFQMVKNFNDKKTKTFVLPEQFSKDGTYHITPFNTPKVASVNTASTATAASITSVSTSSALAPSNAAVNAHPVLKFSTSSAGSTSKNISASTATASEKSDQKTPTSIDVRSR